MTKVSGVAVYLQNGMRCEPEEVSRVDTQGTAWTRSFGRWKSPDGELFGHWKIYSSDLHRSPEVVAYGNAVLTLDEESGLYSGDGTIYIRSVVVTYEDGTERTIMGNPRDRRSRHVLPVQRERVWIDTRLTGGEGPVHRGTAFARWCSARAQTAMATSATYGPTRLPLRSIDIAFSRVAPDMADAIRQNAIAELARVSRPASEALGGWNPLPPKAGDEVGGEGVEFYDRYEVLNADIALELGAHNAIRVADKTDTLAIDEDLGMPLTVSSFERGGKLPFVVYAGKSDAATRLPYFKTVRPGLRAPWREGSCSYEEELLTWEQSDDQHQTRAIRGLQAITALAVRTPLSAWATETLIARAAHLRLAWPEVPHKFSPARDIPSYRQRIASGEHGTFDRDEGLTYHVVACAIDAVNRDSAQIFNDVLADFGGWISDLTQIAIENALPGNGMHQARSVEKQSWTTPAWSRPDGNGDVMPLTERCALSFQQSLIMGGLFSFVRALGKDIPGGERSAKIIAKQLHEAATFMSAGFVRSKGYSYDGKYGPAYVLGVYSEESESSRETPIHTYKEASLMNEPAAYYAAYRLAVGNLWVDQRDEHAESIHQILGSDGTPWSAIRKIARATASDGYGAIDFSAWFVHEMVLKIEHAEKSGRPTGIEQLEHDIREHRRTPEGELDELRVTVRRLESIINHIHAITR